MPGNRSQQALFSDALLTSASDAVIQFLPVYLVFLSASSAQVGLLSSGSGLAGLLALGPGAWLASRVRSRKRVMLWGGAGFARVALLGMAFVPFVFDASGAIIALIVLGSVRALLINACHPAWTALFADVVPDTVRRRFTSWHAIGSSVVAMAAAPLVGLLIEHQGGLGGYQLAFLLAAAIGFVATFAYSRIQEPARDFEREAAEEAEVVASEAAESPRSRFSVRMLRDATFRRFLLATMFLHTASMMAGPFFTVHLVRGLGASPSEVGMIATAGPVSAVVGQVIAGMLVTRVEPKRALLGAMLVAPAAPLLWLVIGEPWQAVAPTLVSGGTWAIIHLASFNLLMHYAPPARLPAYSAAHQGSTMVAAFIGPLIGSALVATAGIAPVFVLSALGRLVALACFALPLRRHGSARADDEAAVEAQPDDPVPSPAPSVAARVVVASATDDVLESQPAEAVAVGARRATREADREPVPVSAD